MGRKIPAKKHRGVKDPLEQQARRIKSEQGRVNAPPADPDEQPVPRSLLRLFAPAPPGPGAAPRRRKGAAPAGNPVSRLARAPGESPRQFARRITDAARALHGAPARYPGEEEEEEAEDARGARMAAQRSRRARRPVPAPAPALTRGQKLTLKKKAKKEEADQARVSEPQYERVRFGDVAHAPPALPAPRAAPRTAGAARPGRRGLLLSAMLGQGAAPPAPPAAEARRRERARAAAVAAYRQLKAERARTARRT